MSYVIRARLPWVCVRKSDTVKQGIRVSLALTERIRRDIVAAIMARQRLLHPIVYRNDTLPMRGV